VGTRLLGAEQYRSAGVARLFAEGRLHMLYRSFFEIHDINPIVHPMSRIPPSYYGVFENNDPHWCL
jgi:hypothetical protein